MSRTHRRTGSVNAHPKTYGAPFAVTSHAIDQFRARVAPGLTVGKARAEAIILSRSAKRSEDRTGAGDEIWVATDGAPVRFVVRLSEGKRVCVTVLGAETEGETENAEVQHEL